jgi:hypothetical protein
MLVMQPDTAGAEHEQRAAEEICRSIYDETATFYKRKAPRVAGEDLGYRILYGPPVVHPGYLFLGDQPGGRGTDSVRTDQLQGCPTECEYGLDKRELRKAGWKSTKLAVNMQKIWGVPVLKKSTGLNAIFFRAPRDEWPRLETGLRIELEKFSLERARRIIEILQPKRLVVIGFKTFRPLATSAHRQVEVWRNGRSLVERSEIWGVPAFGVIHLSGAHLSGADFDAIKAYFGERISN